MRRRRGVAGRACAMLAVLAALGCQPTWEREDAPPPGGPVPPPAWVQAGRHPDFVPPTHVAAFGVSNATPQEADERAEAHLRERLRQSIRGTVWRALAGDGDRAEADSAADADAHAHGEDHEAATSAAVDREVVDGVAAIVADVLLGPDSSRRPSRIPMQRVARYTDGFTFYSLWATNLRALFEQPRPYADRARIADVMPDDAASVTWLAQQAGAEVAHALYEPSAAAAGTADAAPALRRLAALWRDEAEASKAIRLSAPAVVRAQRLTPRDVAVELFCEQTADPRPVTLFAVTAGGPSHVTLLADESAGRAENTSLPASHLRESNGRATFEIVAREARSGIELAVSGKPTTLTLHVTPQPSLWDRGEIWLFADRLAAGFAPWRHTFALAVAKIEYVLPSMDRLRWRSELSIVLDAAPMAEDVVARLFAAVWMAAGYDRLALAEHDAPDVPVPDDAFLLVVRGEILVAYDADQRRPVARGEVRLVVLGLPAANESGADLDGLTIAQFDIHGRGYPDSPGPLPALRAALDRPSIRTLLRREVERFVR